MTQVCTFSVGDLHFGLEVEHVQEVIRFQEMTDVPLSAESVRGLINLRGQIVTAIDMRSRLGIPERDEGELPMNVVLTPEHGTVSLLVDRIGDVLDLERDLLEMPPPTLDTAVRELIRGVYPLSDRLVLAIDADRAIDVDEHSVAATR